MISEKRETAYYRAMLVCCERYLTMTDERNDLIDVRHFTQDLRDGLHHGLPLLKMSRWLGYIQGVLIERGMTTIEDERNYTRPLFRPLDFPDEKV